ncbi:MAG: nucleotidyl transferase AbiEii/AbiGii toxin family protein [Kofleriaceae bacterium]
MSFVPCLTILPAAQRELWTELATLPPTFILYGGTALALRLGHRESVDFDFFSHDPLDHDVLSALPWMQGATTLQLAQNTRTVLIERGASTVKVSMFGAIGFGRVGVPELANGSRLRVASPLDLGGTKIKALLQRVEAKDYLDIDALVSRAGVPLPELLGAALTLFGPSFNPLVARKALAYYEGGDLDRLDTATRERLTRAAVESLVTPEVPRVSARLD